MSSLTMPCTCLLKSGSKSGNSQLKLHAFYVTAMCILVLLPVSASAASLKPFTSDGCSSFPDGTLAQKTLWLNCCTAHDLAYWKGGTYDERVEADIALKDCVEEVGEEEIALLMLAGVRVGGTPFLPTRFRWGYGWGCAGRVT